MKMPATGNIPEPLVSVVLTSYNQSHLLQRAFNSLINQTYKNIEIIIVDDSSSDKRNKELIEEFKMLYPQKVTAIYQIKNVGIPKNKNTGFKAASGEYITYLDGDDTYYEDKVTTEMKTFKQNPDVDIVYSNFDIKNVEDKILSVWAKNFSPAQGSIFKDIVLNNFPDAHTHRFELFKRFVLYELNFYDEEFSVYHDLDLMLRYSLRYKVKFNDYVGSSYYKNPKSIVSKTNGLKLIEQQEQVYKKYRKEIKEQGLQKQFQKRLDNLQLSKEFYANKINYFLLFKAFIKQPYQILKIAKIINYLYKTLKKTVVA